MGVHGTLERPKQNCGSTENFMIISKRGLKSRGISGKKVSRCNKYGRLKSKGLDLLERYMVDCESLGHFQMCHIAEWRGAVGWGFGCVFLFVSLGIIGRVMGWAPQIFLLSVESIDGEVGLWAGGTLGIAVIRCTHKAGIVIWPFWLPFAPLLFGFLLCVTWSEYVLLILWFVYIPRIKSAIFAWRIGWLRLGISHNKGSIRQDQVLVNRYNYISLSLFFLSSLQGLENIWLGQKHVCVVYFRSFWIRGWGIVGNQVK
ncbi:hypothetical protein HanIR_Chr01g0005791 [Helianthus annuus]|nr:hypothetical protein HanIR_Chr01g0005791 [Helianthus annuus]